MWLSTEEVMREDRRVGGGKSSLLIRKQLLEALTNDTTIDCSN